MICPNCGAENAEGSKFCKSCGKELPALPAAGQAPGEAGPVEAPAAAAGAPSEEAMAAAEPPAAPSPPPAAPSPPPAAGAAPVPPPAAPSPVAPMGGGSAAGMPPAAGGPKKSKLPLILTLLGILVVAAVVVVVVFIWKPWDSKANLTGPEKTVQAFFDAIEDGDIGAVIGLLDPQAVRELRREFGSGYEEEFEELLFDGLPGEDVKFTNLEYKTEQRQDEATVTVVKGTLEYTDDRGKKQKDEIEPGDEPEFELALDGDTWYLDLFASDF
ncbi:MAG: zinc-ribbon domain-containing protein [Candidatus Geothermincolia bacterium]